MLNGEPFHRTYVYNGHGRAEYSTVPATPIEVQAGGCRWRRVVARVENFQPEYVSFTAGYLRQPVCVARYVRRWSLRSSKPEHFGRCHCGSRG